MCRMKVLGGWNAKSSASTPCKCEGINCVGQEYLKLPTMTLITTPSNWGIIKLIYGSISALRTSVYGWRKAADLVERKC